MTADSRRPYGTAVLVARVSRDFIPGYCRVVPDGTNYVRFMWRRFVDAPPRSENPDLGHPHPALVKRLETEG